MNIFTDTCMQDVEVSSMQDHVCNVSFGCMFASNVCRTFHARSPGLRSS